MTFKYHDFSFLVFALSARTARISFGGRREALLAAKSRSRTLPRYRKIFTPSSNPSKLLPSLREEDQFYPETPPVSPLQLVRVPLSPVFFLFLWSSLHPSVFLAFDFSLKSVKKSPINVPRKSSFPLGPIRQLPAIVESQMTILNAN